MADFIRYTIEERVATLVIDHPPVNALNRQTLTELDAALDELGANHDVKVIVITGGGQLAFVAGADVGEIGALVKGADALGDPLVVGGHRHPGKQGHGLGPLVNMLDHGLARDQGQGLALEAVGMVAGRDDGHNFGLCFILGIHYLLCW